MRFMNAVRSFYASRFSYVLLLYVAILISTVGSADSAQVKKSSAYNTGSTHASEFSCPAGAKLRLTSADVSQGSLLLVELRGTESVKEVAGEWDGKEIPFWRATPAVQKNVDQRKALVGIDLEHPPGKFGFTISVKTVDGSTFSCAANVLVKKGRFATEKLKVAPQFAEPNTEQLARAEEERKRLRAIFATVTPEKLWNGAFRVPLTGITSGGNFGKRRILNGEPSSPHSGVDFPAAAGTPIHATQSGRVVLAEPLYFSGNTVVLDHGLGIYTLYGHLSSIDVKTGDTVNAGDVLGKVGATGRVTGPHLHWGLTVNGARVNSLDIVKLL
jgi:murein DD-endopeptidase MepM/ murein hydrolase activator NlpD